MMSWMTYSIHIIEHCILINGPYESNSLSFHNAVLEDCVPVFLFQAKSESEVCSLRRNMSIFFGLAHFYFAIVTILIILLWLLKSASVC